jgi:uncharacterized protein YyaL (SSP411 family)
MPNRLAQESSPYLLQHAGNPVDWFPWGDEALSLARAEDRPILLSIGYSACHWCHVMERESFEDPAVAALMNEQFVNVKVDREERPDVDQVYMRAVQAITGQGGWPLTVFLTPRAEPFYGGTYFPSEPRHGLPSFRQVLAAVARAYRDRPDEVMRNATELRQALSAIASAPERAPAEASLSLIEEAVATLAKQYDPAHGGFGGAPKFPQPVTLEVLLRHHARTGDANALSMVVHTLRSMADGGIRDHVGGGFHRYSVDARWLVPHFEKMLYDNALLARAYVDAFRATGEGALREVAEQTLDYVLDDLRSPEGAFYAARDADSGGEEGRYYLWTVDEVVEVLGPERAAPFMRCYDVAPGGNFEGRSILHLPHSIEAVAPSLDIPVERLQANLAEARSDLLEARGKREPPLRDEKILAGWNGLAVRALAEAGAALRRPDYVEAAEAGARFLLDALRLDEKLLRVYARGEARVPAFLEDHASLGNALLSLHEATLHPRWLEEARWFASRVLELFYDDEAGTFFDAAHDAEPLYVRPRDPMDNATPSGNSLALELLQRAGHVFADPRYLEVARLGLAREESAMRRFPTAFGRLLSVLDRSLAPPVELAVVGDREDPRTGELGAVAFEGFHRNITVTGREPGEEVRGMPLLEGRSTLGDAPTAYLCRAYACELPVTDPQALRRRFDALAGAAR